MPLSRDIKAFTFRFLKIVINIEDVEFKNGNNEEDKEILLKAYLMFLLIHEFNHLIKLLNMINIDSEIAVTPRYNEGGKELISLLIGNYLLNQKINLNNAKYILDINNWNKTLSEFKKDYNNIVEDNKEKSIAYLYTGNSEICYTGYLK